LLAVPFDDRRRVATGAPFPIINNIGARNGYQVRLYDVASDGTLAFISPLVTQDTSTLVWRDSSGGREVIARVARMADLPRLSHDGTRVAFRTRAPDCDIWVHDLRRNATTRLTSEGDNHGIVWAAADDRIATFQRTPSHNRALWLPSDGAGPGIPLSPQEVYNAFLFDVSNDERFALVSEQREGSSSDVSVLDLAAKDLRPLLGSRFDESGATLSPDGRLVAYVSNESGRDEVYVQPFPTLTSRVQVSIGGGSEPAWSRDGRNLYFRSGNTLLRAAVEGSASPVVGVPARLFEGTFAPGVSGMRGYDVSDDGRRFLMIERDTVQQQGDNVEVVVNFFSELHGAGSHSAGH
jgi:Tol biopolymer transport system component